MNDYEKYVPEEIRALVAILVDKSRDLIERDGMLEPVAFVGMFGGDINAISGLAKTSKENGARIVRAMAKKTNADFVLYIDEAWLKEIQGATRADADRMRKEAGGEVRNMPGRIDVVMFNLQTHTGAFLTHAVREPLAGKPGKYTFGALKWERPAEAEGRFMTLLPPRGSKQ